MPVVFIGEYAFSGCATLSAVSIPDSVTGIAFYAFYKCSGLTNLVIPDSVVFVAYGAFLDCTGLSSVVIGNGLTSLESHLFSGCFELARVVIGNSVTNISGGAFHTCTNLSSIFIPRSVTGIGGMAFQNCFSLRTVTIPESVGRIDAMAFSNCTGLGRVYFRGNAPFAGEIFGRGVFDESDRVVVYYLPGTSGWAPMFAGRPAALWVPVVPSLPSATPDGPLRLLTSSPAPSTVRVQRSVDLDDWEDWQTVSRDEGPSELQDLDAGTTPYRFYRGIEE